MKCDKTEPVIPEDDSPIVQGVTLKAEGVQRNEDGTFTIYIQRKQLTPGHREMVNMLFPKLSEQVYRLLDQEALLASIVVD